MFRYVAVIVFALVTVVAFAAPKEEPKPLDVNPKPLGSDPSVKLDYDIVYVRARARTTRPSRWTEIVQPGHHGRRAPT